MKYFLSILGLLFAANANAQFVSQQGSVLNLNYNLQNTTPQSFSLTFKNTASTTETLAPATGSGVSLFKVSLNRCVSVLPGKSCQITYSPPRNISVGTYVFIQSGIEVNYQVVNQDSNGPIMITPVETLEILPATVSTLQFAVGERVKTLNLTVKNTGTVPQIPSLGWSGNNANIKMTINRCVSSLVPGKTCSISLQVPSPVAGGEWTQDLQVYVGASLKDTLSLVIKGPASNSENVRLHMENLSYRIHDTADLFNPIITGNNQGEVSYNLPPGSYWLMIKAEIDSETHLEAPWVNHYEPKWDNPAGSSGCSPTLFFGSPEYKCDLIITNGDRGSDVNLQSYIQPGQLIIGCLDSVANNYDPSASFNDEFSCTYNMGCTDSSASNYDSSATRDDGSCTYPVLGCMDLNANNYNSSATQDNGTCTYNYGCTDSSATNYDSSAYYDDDSCEYNTVYNIQFINLFLNPLNIEGNVNGVIATPNGEGGNAIYESNLQSRDSMYYLGDVFGGAAPETLSCDSTGNIGDASFSDYVYFNSPQDRWEVAMNSSIYLSPRNKNVFITCTINGYQYN